MYEQHEFYCINCGNKNIPLLRPKGHKHEKFHRKKMYCYKCHTDINMVECYSYEDVLTFKNDFSNGKYKEEAANSLEFCKGEIK